LLLITTDQDAEVIGSVPLEDDEKVLGRVAVPFRKLMDICRTLPDGMMLRVQEEGDKVVLRGGRSRFTLSSLPAESFPFIEESSALMQFSLPQKILKNLIEQTAFAMAEQDVRYYLNGMLWEVKGRVFSAYAADGHRLACMNAELQHPLETPLRCMIPRKGILELLRLLDGDDEVHLFIGSHHLRAVTSQVTFTSKLLEGRFPDYERLISNTGQRVVVAMRESLKEAFQRAAVLLTEKSRGVRLRLKDNGLKILATNTDQDEVEEDIEVEYPGEDLEIAFNIKYLLDLLNIIPSPRVRFTFGDTNASAMVEGEGNAGRYVIMPLRI